jgi:hypothetical protein
VGANRLSHSSADESTNCRSYALANPEAYCKPHATTNYSTHGIPYTAAIDWVDVSSDAEANE